MKQEERAVRLILAVAEFYTFTSSQLTKTWHRILAAAVLDCSDLLLPYPPPLFPRHSNAGSAPGSPIPKIWAAMCSHMTWCNRDKQHDISANYPATRKTTDQCWQLQTTVLFAAESSICSTFDSSRHSQVCLSSSSVETSCQKL